MTHQVVQNTERQGHRSRGTISRWVLLGLSIPFAIACMVGFALYRAGYFPYSFSSDPNATAIAQDNATCQAVIEKAMLIAGNYCGQVGSNKACYGNFLIQADLAPGTNQKFSERGDIIDVQVLRRLSASSLSPGTDQWGIAIFKLIANLPRSLPGQTITMVVFGNTRLDNTSGNLESFYFSSELGRIVCERAPYDGIMVTVPEGQGIRFIVNGAEVTLMGNASLTATKKGTMVVSLFSGAGRIVSDGQERYFGAGQQVSVSLGGEDGTQSMGPPSAPKTLSQDDFNTACTLLGRYCTPEEIIPVTGEQARVLLQSELSITTIDTPANTQVPLDTAVPTDEPAPVLTNTPLANNTQVVKEKDNNGKAIGKDKEKDNNGKAKGKDK